MNAHERKQAQIRTKERKLRSAKDCKRAQKSASVQKLQIIGNGPNTVSGSTVSNTELSEFFGAH